MDDGRTHSVGDDCPGGHRDLPMGLAVGGGEEVMPPAPEPDQRPGLPVGGGGGASVPSPLTPEELAEWEWFARELHETPGNERGVAPSFVLRLLAEVERLRAVWAEWQEAEAEARRYREALGRLSDEAVAYYGAGPTADFIVERVHAALAGEES